MRNECPVDLPALVPRQQEQWVAEMRSSLSISSHTIINRHIPRDYEVIALTTLVIRHRDCPETYVEQLTPIRCNLTIGRSPVPPPPYQRLAPTNHRVLSFPQSLPNISPTHSTERRGVGRGQMLQILIARENARRGGSIENMN